MTQRQRAQNELQLSFCALCSPFGVDCGTIAAPFRNDYQLLALIEELLPSGESPDHWRYLADRCVTSSPQERGLHPPLLFP
jgi:hypothetical protein